MRVSLLLVLVGCLCVALAASQEGSDDDVTTATTRRTFQRRKHVDLKTTNGTRRRKKKLRRPPQASLPTSAATSDEEYNQSVRSFASAIMDTDTFLRFLKLEESRHMRQNNGTLSTRFLQNPMLRARTSSEERQSAPPPRERKRTRTSRRRYHSVRNYSSDEDERYRQFDSSPRPTFDPATSYASNDRTSETTGETTVTLTSSTSSKDPTNTTPEPTQDILPRDTSSTLTTSKTELSKPRNQTESLKSTTQFFKPTTTPQVEPIYKQTTNHKLENVHKSTPPALEAVQTFSEHPSTVEISRPTTRASPSTPLKAVDAFEPQLGGEAKRPRTRPNHPRNDGYRRPSSRNYETNPQGNNIRSRLDSEETRSVQKTWLRENKRSRAPAESGLRSSESTPRYLQHSEQPLSNELLRPRQWERPAKSGHKSPMTTRRYETTSQPDDYPQSRSAKEDRRPKPFDYNFKTSPSATDNERLNYDTEVTSKRYFEASTQSPLRNYDTEVTSKRYLEASTQSQLRNYNTEVTPKRYKEASTQSQLRNYDTEVTSKRYKEASTQSQSRNYDTEVTSKRYKEASTQSQSRNYDTEVTSKRYKEAATQSQSRNYDTEVTSKRYMEASTQSQVYPESSSRRKEEEYQYPRSFSQRENVQNTNSDEQQVAYESGRGLNQQVSTAAPTNHNQDSGFNREEKRSRIFERYDNSNSRQQEERPRSTPNHFFTTAQPTRNEHRFSTKVNLASKENLHLKIPLDRFQIVPISEEDQQSTYDDGRSQSGKFETRRNHDFDYRVHDDITPPSVRFLPPEYSDKIVSDPEPERRVVDGISPPSRRFQPPEYSERQAPSGRSDSFYSPTTERSYPVFGEDYDEVRVPNRGLQPPIEPIGGSDEYSYLTPSPPPPVPIPVNSTASIERRAPPPLKKGTRQPKSRAPDRYRKHPDDEYDELRLTPAESTYYKKRKLTTVPMIESYDSQQVIPGVAGRDYTVFSTPPDTHFTCGTGHMGYVADVAAGCQAFYVCTGVGRGEPMLCPNGTLFNQDVLVCDWWFNVSCNQHNT